MPSVAEELAELRKKSLAQNHASKLKGAKGLSTPEQEEQVLKEEKEKGRFANYKKEAVQNLNAGTTELDQDLSFKVKQINEKKHEKLKVKEASKILSAGTNAAYLERQGQTSKASEKIESSSLESKSSPVSGEVDDVPDLKEGEKSEDVPLLEDVPDLGDLPELTQTSGSPVAMENSDPAVAPPSVQNRAEKKARKMMQKLGMTQVFGVSRATLKLSGKREFYTIYSPDVFEKNGSYVMFGEARQGTGIPQAQQQQQQQQTEAVQQLQAPTDDKAPSTPTDEEEEVDESGVDAKDVELVMDQAGCSRSKAVAALKANDGDLVNSIMSLTT